MGLRSEVPQGIKVGLKIAPTTERIQDALLLVGINIHHYGGQVSMAPSSPRRAADKLLLKVIPSYRFPADPRDAPRLCSFLRAQRLSVYSVGDRGPSLCAPLQGGDPCHWLWEPALSSSPF